MNIGCRVVALALLWPAIAPATTYRIRPDGTGDLPTIAAAVEVAADGDTLLLDDGIFTGSGNRDIEIDAMALTILSVSGDPEACILDCEGAVADPHFAVLVTGAGNGVTRFEGLGVRNGLGALSAITLRGGASVLIEECVFENNTGNWSGAILCAGSEAIVEDCVFYGNHGEAGGGMACYECSPTLERCRFISNSSLQSGGAIDVHYYAGPDIRDCLFVRNLSRNEGGAVRCGYRSAPRITGCTFVENEASQGGAVSCYYDAAPAVRSCTFHANEALEGCAVFLGASTTATIDHCILAFGRLGEAVDCEGGSAPTLVCCDVYGNEGGDWVGCIAGQLGANGNRCEDPLFCDPDGGNFGLSESSPCAPDGECGLIGGWPVSCGPVATEATTWGAIKAMSRGW